MVPNINRPNIYVDKLKNKENLTDSAPKEQKNESFKLKLIINPY